MIGTTTDALGHLPQREVIETPKNKTGSATGTPGKLKHRDNAGHPEQAMGNNADELREEDGSPKQHMGARAYVLRDTRGQTKTFQ